jgi:hypothetical protein
VQEEFRENAIFLLRLGRFVPHQREISQNIDD